MVVVQWSDLTGTGFSPQRRGSDAPAEYWSAAEALLLSDLSQPPEGIRDTGQHPIWTLRQVSVGRLRTWCFAVQGRLGDDFGVAGTCRFAFALHEMDAVEAWKRGIEATGVRPAPRHTSDTEVAGGVRQVLRSVIAGQDRIPVGLGPADTASVIACVLAVLPEAEARTWSWSTCVLLPPGRHKRREVSGSWPEDFRAWESRLAQSVKMSFEESLTTTQDIRQMLDATRIDGFEDLVDKAVRGLVDPDLRRTCHNLQEVILMIRRSSRKLGIDDVTTMIESPMGAAELFEHDARLLSQWAAKRPDEASRQLPHVTHLGAAGKILAELLAAERAHSRNLLGLPTAEQPWPNDWHDRLIEILSEGHSHGSLKKHVEAWQEGVWADPEDAAVGRDFLAALGMNRDGFPQFYRARPSVIVNELTKYGEVTDALRNELGFEQNPMALLVSLAPKLPLMSAETAALLIRTADRGGDGAAVESLVAGLTRSMMVAGEAETWVRKLVTQVPANDPLAAHMLAGGLRSLAEGDAEVPRADLLAVGQLVTQYTPLPKDTTTLIRAAERRTPPMHVPAAQGVAPAVAHGVARPPVPQRVPYQAPPVEKAPEPATPEAPKSWRHWWEQQEPGRKRRLLLSVGGLLTVAVGATVAVLLLRPDDGGDEPLPPLTPTTTVARTTADPAPAALEQHLETIPLAGGFQQQQAAQDASTFDAQFQSLVGDGQVTAVIVLAVRGDEARAQRLSDHLLGFRPLAGVPVKSVEGIDRETPGPPGAMQVLIVFSR
jgi:hypothetical protein